MVVGVGKRHEQVYSCGDVRVLPSLRGVWITHQLLFIHPTPMRCAEALLSRLEACQIIL